MKWARVCVFVYCTIVLSLIVRRAAADSNACPTRVTGGETAEAQIHCPDAICETDGLCEGVTEEDWSGVTFWLWLPAQGGWVAYGGGEGDIEYCACIAWEGDPPYWYIQNEEVSNICCRAVAFKPATGGSWVGTVGSCGDHCGSGDCELENDPLGGVRGTCR